MKQINKHQQDWDEPINENFAKFSNSEFFSNTIYLNGATRDSAFPLWYRCYNLGEAKLYTIQGFIDMPDLAVGQSIDVFNVPGITGTIRFLSVQNVEAKKEDTILMNSSSANGTFTIVTRSSEPIKNWHPRYSILVICDNE